MGTEERATTGAEVEAVYKTKVVQFFDRSVPIILQNDNGPCPLIAISNVLLLRNNLNLSLDTSEVPLQKLLSLVAERLIDSNINVEDMDVGYVQNQEKNIADAMERLHRLATGIDVNLHFRKINDFEFTPERAIFDLLGIELYHGWIVDPQDIDTLKAIGSKSYNALIGELVSLETRNEEEDKCVLEEDSVDFAAATTAALGVPSPCLSRGMSFDDSPVSVTSDQKVRKGDVEEEEELMRVLQLSKADIPLSPQSDDLSDLNQSNLHISSEESVRQQFSNSGDFADNSEISTHIDCQRLHQIELNASQDVSACSNCDSNVLPSSFISPEPAVSILTTTAGSHLEQSKISEPADCFISGNNSGNIREDVLIQNQTETSLFPDRDASVASCTFKDQMSGLEGDQIMLHAGPKETPLSFDHPKPTDDLSSGSKLSSAHDIPSADSDSFEGVPHADVSEGVASSMDGSEPIYEGEERILDVGHSTYENREPMYEGEMVLAVQADGGAQGDNYGAFSKDEDAQQKSKGPLSINAEQGELIRNFLKNNASQLTIYGLFCLQEDLKERELCVFFRNNHFSTMFKFNGELYLLATDQGYINQPDLVWEKLNEVNGDTVFMTGNFKEFKAENQANESWDEQNAMTSTADYLASIDNSTIGGSTLNSDLQLAIALQQQEFENQSQRQTPPNVQQSHVSSHSRLVTGPQGPRSSNSSSTKHDAKTKDKCTVM